MFNILPGLTLTLTSPASNPGSAGQAPSSVAEVVARIAPPLALPVDAEGGHRGGTAEENPPPWPRPATDHA